MTRAALLLVLTPFAASAQLSLFSVDGSKETAVGASFDLGQVAAGDSKDVRLRARDSGIIGVTVSKLAISGFGFTIIPTPSIPFYIAPGNFLDVYVHFAGGPPASYSANFQINGISVLLKATSVPAPALVVLNGCTGPDPISGVIDFATLTSGQKKSCTLALQNMNAQAVTVGTVSVSGSAFQISTPLSPPVTLAPGGALPFAINFSPPTSGVYAGLLTVDTRSFPLTGAALTPPLPTPILEFDSGIPASAQQRTVTMRLPAPSPVAASGSVNLVFQPDTKIVTSDPAVVFVATGARSVPFSIRPGDMQINLGGQAGAVFQTGTTSGRITFTISINTALNGDPTIAMIVPPAWISFDKTSAIARAGALDVQAWGFDNTYSTGSMTFTFYDVAGKPITPGAIAGDFTSAFQTYFSNTQAGSSFQMLVTFPVSGQANQVSAVDFQMTNAAGSTAVQHLQFINDTGQCIVISATQIVCP